MAIFLRAIGFILSAGLFLISAYTLSDYYYFKFFSVKAEGIITSVQIPEVHSRLAQASNANHSIISEAEYSPNYQIDYQDLNHQPQSGVLVGLIGQAIYKSGDVIQFSYLQSNTQKLRQVESENPWPTVSLCLFIACILLAFSLRSGFRKRVSY